MLVAPGIRRLEKSAGADHRLIFCAIQLKGGARYTSVRSILEVALILMSLLCGIAKYRNDMSTQIRGLAANSVAIVALVVDVATDAVPVSLGPVRKVRDLLLPKIRQNLVVIGTIHRAENTDVAIACFKRSVDNRAHVRSIDSL